MPTMTSLPPSRTSPTTRTWRRPSPASSRRSRHSDRRTTRSPSRRSASSSDARPELGRLPLAEVGEHRQHAAVVLARLFERELREDPSHVALDRLRVEHEALGDALVRAALGHEAQDLALSRRQLVERAVGAGPSEEPRDDLRVDDRLAGRDAADRIGEVADPGHMLLEEIADRGRALTQEVDGVPRLDDLREDEDADGRVGASDLARRLEALGRVGRRHADIDHEDVRARCADELDEPVDPVGLADDLEPAGSERRRDGLAQEHRVIGEDDAQRALAHRACAGIRAWSTVPPPGGLSMVNVPPTAPMRSTSPWSPDPRRGSAPPRPSSTIVTDRSSRSSSASTVTSVAPACFTAFVTASATRK